MRSIKPVIGIIGCIISLIGWTIAHSEKIICVQKVLTPKYINAMNAYEKMHKKDFELEKSDKGFKEIIELIKENITSTSKEIPEIVKLRTVDWSYNIGDSPTGMSSYDQIKLEVITVRHGSSTGDFQRLSEKIRDKYLTNPLFKWCAWMFGIGLFISFFSHCISLKEKRDQVFS